MLCSMLYYVTWSEAPDEEVLDTSYVVYYTTYGNVNKCKLFVRICKKNNL